MERSVTQMTQVTQEMRCRYDASYASLASTDKDYKEKQR